MSIDNSKFPLGIEIVFGDSGSGRVVDHAVEFGTGKDVLVLVVRTAGGRIIHVYPDEHPRAKGTTKPYDLASESRSRNVPVSSEDSFPGELSFPEEHTRDLLDKLQDTYQVEGETRPSGPVLPLSKSLGSLDAKLNKISSATLDPSIVKQEKEGDTGALGLEKLKALQLGSFSFGQAPAEKSFSSFNPPPSTPQFDPTDSDLLRRYKPRGGTDPRDSRIPYELLEDKIPTSGTGVPEMGGSKPPPRPPRKPPTAPPDDEGDDRRPLPRMPGMGGRIPTDVPANREEDKSPWYAKLFKHFRNVVGEKTGSNEAEYNLQEAETNAKQAEIERKGAKRDSERTATRLRQTTQWVEASRKTGSGMKRAQRAQSQAKQRHKSAQARLDRANEQSERAQGRLDKARHTYDSKQAATNFGAAERTASALGFHGIGQKLNQFGQIAQGGAAGPAAAIQAVREKLEEAGQNIGKMVTSSRAGDIGSGFFGATGAMAELGGPAMAPVAMFAKLGTALSDSVEKLRTWNDSLLASHMEFSKFSGAMAMVAAETERRRILFEKDRGDRRADSARNLSESRDRLERNLAPIEDAWANIKSDFLAEINNGISKIIEAIWGAAETKEEGPDMDMEVTEAGSKAWEGWEDNYTGNRPPRFR